MGQLCGSNVLCPEEGEYNMEGSFMDKQSREEWFFKEDSVMSLLRNGQIKGNILVKNADLRLGTYRPYVVRGQINTSLTFSYDGKTIFQNDGIRRFAIGPHHFAAEYDSKSKRTEWRLLYDYSGDSGGPSASKKNPCALTGGISKLSIRLQRTEKAGI